MRGRISSGWWRSGLTRKIDIYIAGQTREANRVIHPDLSEGDVSVRWEGELEPGVTGDYLFQAFSNSGIRLWIGDQLLMNHWRQSWLPWKDLARIHLEAKHRITCGWNGRKTRTD